MLRVSLHLMGAAPISGGVPNCDIYVTPHRRGSGIEVWTWCKTADDLLALVEKLLNDGLLPVAFGLLDGRLVRITSLELNPEEVERLATAHTTLTGVIALEVYEEELSWAKMLIKAGVKRLEVDLMRKRATIETSTPITTIQLYDNKLRVVKPKRIPP